MPQIYIAAAVATVVAVGLWGMLFYFMSREHIRWAWFVAVGLPLSYVVNVAVKRPLASFISELSGLPPVFSLSSPLWWLAFLHFLAPVTEEAVKVLPALWPGVRARLRDRSVALWAGVFVGAGFGLGELWYVAANLAHNQLYAGVPWWHFTGFMTERLMVVYVHAVLTAVALVGLARGRGWRGYLTAVGLHALVNLGALLYLFGWIKGGQAQVTLGVAVIGLTYVLQNLYRANPRAVGADQGDPSGAT